MVSAIQENTFFYTHCKNCGNYFLGQDKLIKASQCSESYVITIFFPRKWHGFISNDGLEIVSLDGRKMKMIRETGDFRLKIKKKSLLITRREHVCPQNKVKGEVVTKTPKQDNEKFHLVLNEDTENCDLIVSSNTINDLWRKQVKKKYQQNEASILHHVVDG